jgi:Cysteine-rich domain
MRQLAARKHEAIDEIAADGAAWPALRVGGGDAMVQDEAILFHEAMEDLEVLRAVLVSDMATYKAEFLSHYYSGRLRPLSAYAMGLVMWWAPLAMLEPGLANFLLGAPALGPSLRRLAGFAPDRPPPPFAAESFRRWYRRRPNQGTARRSPVILWPDTFNNYFLPGTAKAAVHILEHAGYEVIVPQQLLCCGRLLYDYGMLDLAKRKLRQTIDVLRPAIRAGIPVVGLEPSCVSVFRVEMLNLMPEDEDAQRLARQTKMLSEFLLGEQDWVPPRYPVKALLHTHCHHKAVLQADSDRALLERMGVDLLPSDAGCCGQAGSFWYETERAPIAAKIGELSLLPAVRKAAPQTMIIASGFSCREQVRLGTGRKAIHTAELIAGALSSGACPPAQELEERCREPIPAPRKETAIAAIAAGTLLGTMLLLRKRRALQSRVSEPS